MKKAVDKIIMQLGIAISYLGGDLEILATVGSYGDTLSDAEILSMLKDWNERKRASGDWTRCGMCGYLKEECECDMEEER